MTTAREESERRYPGDGSLSEHELNRARFRVGFIKGAEWQAKQPVEITEEMVEDAAKAMGKNFNPEKYPVMFAMFSDYARVALEATLGGSDVQSQES